MSKTSAAQLKSIQKYNKEQTVTVLLRLNKKTDADLIERLGKVPSKNGYLRKLIYEDILNDNLSEEE